MKLIFLDFDGVLNNPGCYAIASGERVPAHQPAVDALNHITRSTGALIVVSSTWRYMGLMPCREKLHEWGVEAGVIDCTPRLPDETRGAEIANWLQDYERHKIQSFVILDDDKDMDGLSVRLVQTQGHVGLTMADAERAIAMLGASR